MPATLTRRPPVVETAGLIVSRVPGREFAQAIRAVLPSIGEGDRYRFDCVALRLLPNGLAIEATDGRELAEATAGLPPGVVPSVPPVLIDAADAKKIAQAARRGPATIEVDGRLVVASGDGWRVACGVQEGRWPETFALWPDLSKGTGYHLDAAHFRSALRQALTCTDEYSTAVELTAEPKELIVTAGCVGAAARIRIPASRFRHDPGPTDYTGRKLCAIVSRVKRGEYLTLFIGGENSPAVIEAKRFRCAVMPLSRDRQN